MMTRAEKVDDILPLMRKKLYKHSSNLNMMRDTNKMVTSSQLLLDLTNKVLKLTFRENQIESFEGIKRDLPNGYTPKIKIVVTKLSN
jgi:hypothetical protein